jgi:hypothetical protein
MTKAAESARSPDALVPAEATLVSEPLERSKAIERLELFERIPKCLTAFYGDDSAGSCLKDKRRNYDG